MRVPKRRSEQDRLAKRQDDHYLTPDAIERLTYDLEDLKKTQRPKALEDLTRAREMGDLSENAAYTEAKSRLGRIDGRIFSLQERLKYAVVIESGADSSGNVRIGSKVIVAVNGQEKNYEILGSQETNPGRGRISHLSPVGAALLGHKVGDNVSLEINNKKLVYRIVSIK